MGWSGFAFPTVVGRNTGLLIQMKYTVEWGYKCVNLHFSPYTHAPLRDGGFEIREQDVKTSQALEQAIEWTKNITSAREPYSERDPLLKRRPELIMHVVASMEGAGNALAFN